ncbi:MAG: hypothetical protein WCZ18_11000 [Ottowia sp.]
MSKARLSRTAAVVIMTSALAWNLPVQAQDDTEGAVSVTVVSDAGAGETLERDRELLHPGSEASPEVDE